MLSAASLHVSNKREWGRAHRRAGSDRLDLIWARQGEVSHTMGHLPFSLACGRGAQAGRADYNQPQLANKTRAVGGCRRGGRGVKQQAAQPGACLEQRRLQLRALLGRRVLEAARVKHHAAAAAGGQCNAREGW